MAKNVKTPGPIGDDFKKLARVGIVIVAIVVSIILSANPQVRSSSGFRLLIGVLVTIPVLYFSWFAKRKPPMAGRVLETIGLLALWGMQWSIASRFALLVWIVLLYGLLIYMGGLYLFGKAYYDLLGYSTLGLAVPIVTQGRRYAYLSDDMDLTFTKIALIGSLILSLGVAFPLATKGLIRLKSNTVKARLTFAVIVFMLSFGLLFTTFAHFNFILDEGETEEYTAVIIDKDVIGTGSKRRRSYWLELQLEQSVVSLQVSGLEYEAYEVGDPYSVRLYQGALGEAFYISNE